jgi:hypothetical protein
MPPDDPKSAQSAPGEGAPETAAWADVVCAWDDEAAHRAYLARFADLDGLAIAGGRYRAVLEERPDDAMARRFRDEVLRRATAAGLALMPRPRPRSTLPRPVQVLLVALFLAAIVSSVIILWRRAAHLIPDIK